MTQVVYHLLENTGWSTVVVNGTRQIPNGNFHGDTLVPFPQLFPERQDQRRSRSNDLEPEKTSEWNAHFAFGNSVWEFWSTFQEIPFSRENFRSGRQNYSFYLQSIRNFRILWVNGKQPQTLLGRLLIPRLAPVACFLVQV